MNIIKLRKFTYLFSGILVALSLVIFFVIGLKPGIDFTGGSLLEVGYRGAMPSLEQIREALAQQGFPNAVVQPTGEGIFFIRTEHLTDVKRQEILSALRLEGADLQERRFDNIGPTIGAELRQRSIWAIVLVITLIVLYIAWAFRKVSEPVSSWKYGVATVIALVHDVMIPIGVFSLLGKFYGVEVDTLFITALLTILGFSVHDTIVVFDRIRENLKDARGRKDFEQLVNESISQTVTRSVNTSLTVLLVLLAIYFFGGESVRYFSLALIIGIAFGTYSSIFLASPILVTWHQWSERRKK